MTYEEAFYHKMMLLAGRPARFDRAVDDMLAAENPLSDLALALAFCGGDRKKQLAALDDYLLTAPPGSVDYDVVAEFALDDLRAVYEENPDDLPRLMQTVGRLVRVTRDADCDSGLWDAMDVLFDFWLTVEDDLASLRVQKAAFMTCLKALLYEKKAISPWKLAECLRPPSLMERIRSFFRR